MRISALPAWLMLLSSPALADNGSFFETFETLDRERWYISDGWSNGSHQSCVWTADNVRLVDNKIELSLTDTPRKDHPHSCGELQTTAFYGYGTYEVRMKAAPAHTGMVSAFFTYTGPSHGQPHDEIDFEFIGAREKSVDASYHAKGNGGRIQSVALDFDPRAGFNDFALHWTPDRLTWYANGKVLREVTRTEDEEYPTTPGKIIISIWSGTAQLNDWLGPFTYPGQPIVASYEHIAFTKLGDDCQFPDSLVCTLGKDKLGGK